MSAQGAVRDRYDPGFDLIETMRWEPEIGFLRLERHLDRLYRSARQLGFDCDVEAVGRCLGAVMADHALRVRLLLRPNGEPSVTSQPFLPLEPETVWTVRLASARLSSTERLNLHKTTRRDAYTTARNEFTVPHADEVLLLNERGEVCEGTITNVFLDDGAAGPLKTPALDCGLLPGVLRAEMIHRGEAEEAVLMPGDLMRAARLFVGNSLRGLIRARMAG